MADYFTNVSIEAVLPKNAIRYAMEMYELSNDFAWEGESIEGAVLEGTLNEDLARDVLLLVSGGGGGALDTEIETDGRRLSLYSQGNADIDFIIDLLQLTLKFFDLDDVVSFEWAYDCSKPRADAFGGGAAIVTKDECITMNTWEWLEKELKQLVKEEKSHDNI